jgi:hypothetical protein
MYLHLELFRRNFNTSDSTVDYEITPQLVNMDWATVIEVERDRTDTAGPLFLSIQFAPAGASVSTYYFGPSDMTEAEQTARRDALYRRLAGGAMPVRWSKEADDAARAEERPLTSAIN